MDTKLKNIFLYTAIDDSILVENKNSMFSSEEDINNDVLPIISIEIGTFEIKNKLYYLNFGEEFNEVYLDKFRFKNNLSKFLENKIQQVVYNSNYRSILCENLFDVKIFKSTKINDNELYLFFMNKNNYYEFLKVNKNDIIEYIEELN